MMLPMISEKEFCEHIEDDDFPIRYGNPVCIHTNDGQLLVCITYKLYERLLESVPIEETGMDLPAKYPTVESLLERAEGNYPRGGRKEGIVIRPTEPVYCELIHAELSMKVVSNKYLLKNE